MPTPPKPFSVLKSEKKSHRTKGELNQRKKGEESLATGAALRVCSEVKNNPVAHKEFARLNRLLKSIKKNDAIYEAVINRYCIMFAECTELVERREFFYKLIQELRSGFHEVIDQEEISDKALLLLEFTREMAKLTSGMMNIDKLIQSKRKMLLDIEKENIMTIAAALRSIPKKEEKASNPLLEALKKDG